MFKNAMRFSLKELAITLVIVFAALVSVFGINQYQVHAATVAAQMEARAARMALEFKAQQADEEFFSQVASRAAAAQQAEVFAKRTAALEAMNAENTAARSVLDASNAVVADENTRVVLTDAINQVQVQLDTGSWWNADEVTANLAAAKAAVEESMRQWTAEQERIAAEKAAAEKAAARAASSGRASATGYRDQASAPVSSAAAGVTKLNLGACLNGPGGSAAEVQAIIDAGCTSTVSYGPSPWLAAHNYLAGNSWKAMPDGSQFSYAGRIYQVTGRNSITYSAGQKVDLGALVYGDLTLQTCISSGHIVFIHANVVG